MKILIDHQIFTFQDYGGISRIYTELYKQFQENPDIDVEMPIKFSNNFYLEELKDFDYKNFMKIPHSMLNKLFLKAINDLHTDKKLMQNNFDVFQPTYYNPYFLYLLKKPFVLSVYDMTHEIFPETVSKYDRTIPWKRKLLAKASKIIAISESTKNDLIDIYGIKDSKIEIVYLATSLKLDSNYKTELKLPSKYILYVGNRKGYKNFDTFIQAVAKILNEDDSLQLVCAGGGEFTNEENKLILDLGIGDQIKQIHFSNDKDLAVIYNQAKCFVFPSKYEGFGIPVLEAFACECPVIISEVSSLPEVGENAVKYFDPNDENSIYEVVKEVLSSEEIRKKLVLKGRERAKEFSWEKTVKGYLDCYFSV